MASQSDQDERENPENDQYDEEEAARNGHTYELYRLPSHAKRAVEHLRTPRLPQLLHLEEQVPTEQGNIRIEPRPGTESETEADSQSVEISDDENHQVQGASGRELEETSVPSYRQAVRVVLPPETSQREARRQIERTGYHRSSVELRESQAPSERHQASQGSS